MMNIKNLFSRNTITLLLFVALMLPSTVQFFHLFEEHEHITCTESATHIHDTIIQCEICDFQLTSFNYDVINYHGVLVLNIPQKNIVNFTSLQFHSFTITNTQLRAPPIFS